MERKIGEIFTYNDKMYQVVKSDICENCAFRENDCSILRSRIGLCVSRQDLIKLMQYLKK